MKAHELREMTVEELENHRHGLVEQIVNLRIKLAVRQLDNPLSVKVVRKEIARTNTVLAEKATGIKPGKMAKQKD